MRCAIVLACVFFLAGCSVRLDAERAVAEPLTDREIRNVLESEGAPSAPGSWYRVSALLPRSSVRRIARWELYTHIVVEDCRSGAQAAVVSEAEVETTKGDFQAILNLLAGQPQRRSFALSGTAFIRAGTRLDSLCLRLDGGSYTLQKIASAPVRLHFARQLQAG